MGFKKLESKLASQPGITNPGAVAASIGRKKYTKTRFQEAAAKGNSLQGAPQSKRYVKKY
jgi:hypothetical protein